MKYPKQPEMLRPKHGLLHSVRLLTKKEVLLQDGEIEEYLTLNKTFRSSPSQQRGGESLKRRRGGEEGSRWG